MKIALKSVVDNPFRNVSKYPLNPAKVSALVESIRKNGWWENIVGRVVKGTLQIAHGHHRLAALRTVYGGEVELSFVEKTLTNAEMIRLMSAENDVRNRGDLYAAIESVSAAVQALADGEIKQEEIIIPDKNNTQYLRYAPSFISGSSVSPGDTHPYTAMSLAKFLGATRKSKSGEMPSKRVDAALLVLENQQLGIWNDKTVRGFTNPNTGILSAKDVAKAAQDAQYRAKHAGEKAKLQVKDATAAIKAGQAQLEAERQENAKRQAAYDAEVKQLADLAEEDDKATADRKAQERKEREAKEKANEAEFKRKEKESKDRIEAAEKRRLEAEKVARAAAAKQALANKPPKGSEPKPTFFPELTAGINMLKTVCTGKCIIEVRKVPMNTAQKAKWKADLNDTAAFLTAEAKRY